MQIVNGLLKTNNLISIVIPMYNEENRILYTLNNIFNYLNSVKNIHIKNYEIILIDDGSTDKTIDVLKPFENKVSILKLDKNYGKGRAVKEGVLNSKGDFVLYIDADDAVDMSHIDLFIPHIDNYDILIGSRKSTNYGHTLNINKNIRKVIRFTGTLLNKTLVKNVFDTQCPFKLIKGNLAREVFEKMLINRYAFDLEFLSLSQKKGYLIKEIDVKFESKDGSKFRVFKDLYFTFVDFVKIHSNFLFGKYG
jgi:dolichyl-phosphate beta-glucosyltransferase